MKTKDYLRTIVGLILMSIVCIPAFAEKKGTMKFEELTYDFGIIKEDGGPVSHDFEFTNDGDGNLVVLSAKAECGCTKPEFPEAPVGPGNRGVIKVTYNPLGRPGAFTKTVTVKSNGNPSKVVLKIRGTVKPKN